MKIYITHISRRLKNLREEKKLTQEELAHQLGISRQSIISAEKGKCLPSLPLALKIAEIFDLTLEEIFNPQTPVLKEGFKKGGETNMDRDLIPWSPFRDIDRFFDEEMPVRHTRVFAFPAVNVKQTDKDVIVTADIPGVKENDLQLEVGENSISLSGERREEKEEKDEGYFRREVSYGSFHRQIPLPTAVKSDKAEATLTEGQLKIVIPKLEAAKPKVTKIKVKKA